MQFRYNDASKPGTFIKAKNKKWLTDGMGYANFQSVQSASDQTPENGGNLIPQ